MRKKYFFLLISILCTSIVMSSSVVVTARSVNGWYCIRNTQHHQPQLDENMRFIEKYNAYYVDKKHSENSNEKVVYLTFDVGYENGNVEKILNTLKDEQVTGAFFILGNLLEKNPELICRMNAEGHTVGNHTYSHKDMTKFDNIDDFEHELNRLSGKYKDVTGADMKKYYRPPEGKFDERTLSYASTLGYKTIFWSFAYADWDNARQPSAEYAKAKIFDNMHNGAVILLHPTSSTNATILKDVIKQLKIEGYRFATLDELTEE